MQMKKMETIPAEIMSLESVRDWLKDQPGSTRYSYTAPADCVLARYLHAKGYAHSHAGPYTVHVYNEAFLPLGFRTYKLPSALNRVAQGFFACWTYRSALRRVRWELFKQRWLKRREGSWTLIPSLGS